MTKEEQIKSIMLEWINKQSHDKCWYYPELFNRICEVLEIDAKQLPDIPREVFQGGCRRFTDELYAVPTEKE
jgi:hypothetical protein